jgi:hypothetical protein
MRYDTTTTMATILMALEQGRETVALEGVPIGGGYDSLGFPPPCGEGKPS